MLRDIILIDVKRKRPCREGRVYLANPDALAAFLAAIPPLRRSPIHI
jgi:hypothetical protein